MIRRASTALVAVLLLSACAAEEDPEPSPEPSASPSPTAPSAPIVLSFGDAESVDWQPADDVEGALRIKVDKVTEADLKDFRGLVGAGFTRANQPYYVDVVLANEGSAELGGLDVPLYLQDSTGTLAPPWGFAKPFKPCPSGPLPESFGDGDQVKKCLVFLASPEATMRAITYWPEADAQPVRWIGSVDEPAGRSKGDKPAGRRGTPNR